jgi:hypothetical protein
MRNSVDDLLVRHNKSQAYMEGGSTNRFNPSKLSNPITNSQLQPDMIKIPITDDQRIFDNIKVEEGYQYKRRDVVEDLKTV